MGCGPSSMAVLGARVLRRLSKGYKLPSIETSLARTSDFIEGLDYGMGSTKALILVHVFVGLTRDVDCSSCRFSVRGQDRQLESNLGLEATSGM